MIDVKHVVLDRLLVTTALAVTLVASPVGLALSGGALGLSTQTAMAMGNGGGNSGGNGGGNSGGGSDHGGGNGNSGGGSENSGSSDNGNSGSGKDHASAVGSSGPGKSDTGSDKSKTAKEAVQERYLTALESDQENKGRGNDRDVGRPEYQLNISEAKALVDQGWGARRTELDDGFVNHGARVTFYVEMARALDLPSYYGAMWANFGTATENGLAALAAAAGGKFDPDSLTDAETTVAEATAAEEEAAGAVTALEQEIADATAVLEDPDATDAEIEAAQQDLDDATAALTDAEVALAAAEDDTQTAQDEFDQVLRDAEAAESLAAEAQTELDEAVAAVKPGGGPGGGWETIDLDQNGDGSVDETDLALLQGGDGEAEIVAD